MNNWEVNIHKVLTEYTDEVNEALREEIPKIAEETVDELKNTLFPDAVGTDSGRYTRRLWTNYAKGWVVKTKDGENFIHCTVYNKKKPQLTSWLEYGHATRNGGNTRAFPHVKPAEEKANEKMKKKTEEIVKKGGRL